VQFCHAGLARRRQRRRVRAVLPSLGARRACSLPSRPRHLELTNEQPARSRTSTGWTTSLCWVTASAPGQRRPRGLRPGTSQVHRMRRRENASRRRRAGRHLRRQRAAGMRPRCAKGDCSWTCKSEGARQIAEELRWRVGVKPAGDDDEESLLPKPRAEPGGAPRTRWTLHGHMGSVDACAVSADGATVASEGEDAPSRLGARLGQAAVDRSESCSLHRRHPTPRPAMARERHGAALGRYRHARHRVSPDGHFLAHVWSELVTLWNLESSALGTPHPRTTRVRGLARAGRGVIQACRADVAEERFRVWFTLPGDEVAWAISNWRTGTSSSSRAYAGGRCRQPSDGRGRRDRRALTRRSRSVLCPRSAETFWQGSSR